MAPRTYSKTKENVCVGGVGWDFELKNLPWVIPGGSPRTTMSCLILKFKNAVVNVDIQFDQILTLEPNVRKGETKSTQYTTVSPSSGLLRIAASSSRF